MSVKHKRKRDFEVNIVNEQGETVETKHRETIDKSKESLHAIHLIGLTENNEVILALIPQKEQIGYQGVFEGNFGNITATLVRKGENRDQAAKRAAKEELFQEDLELHFMGESYDEFENGVKRYHSTYYFVHHGKSVCFNREDVAGAILLQRDLLQDWVEGQPELFADTFLTIWKRYSHLLPIQ